MNKTTVVTLILWLWVGAAHGATIDFVYINNSVVADKLMPAGTEVKIRVRQLSAQFNANISLDCYPESVFTPGRPADPGIKLKHWLAVDMLAGDVLRYTTAQRCFIGFSVGPDYRNHSVAPLGDGYRRITIDQTRGHRWVFDVKFPDYEF